MRHGCALALTILSAAEPSAAYRIRNPGMDADSVVPDSSDSRMVPTRVIWRKKSLTLAALARPNESDPILSARDPDRAKPVWWESIALGAGSRYPGVGNTQGPASRAQP
jgi:hypothetical protein